MMVFYKMKHRPVCNFLSHQYEYWHCTGCGRVFVVYCKTCDKMVMIEQEMSLFTVPKGVYCVDCLIDNHWLLGRDEV